ncbi:uncharacterized protein LOC122070347 [Macadamia integrifolia]|uniref:uncharacterized protein LOC122070347 n=1 Tax=Macadamia integrifolia TaxID=60698 RepID=UPI001C4EB693|nr:uncharacterized protein LOC122070347 [Macadamia integrifolia]
MAALDGASSTFTFTTGFSSYDVFLNFRGEDTRNSFTSFLNLIMKDKGINVFIDSENLWTGEAIGPSLLKAIDGSKISIPVFSQGYANSKWCLLELAQIRQCHISNGQLVLPIFFYVDPSHVRNQIGSFEEAFREHKKNFEPHIVDSWRKALRVVGSLKGEVIDKNTDQGKIVELVIRRILDELVSNTHLDECKYPIGIDSRVKEMLSLLSMSSDDVQFIGICGSRGIGKTTIAKIVYNRILSNFKKYSFISDVSKQAMQCMGLVSLQKRLLKDIFKIDLDVGHYHKGKKLIEHHLCKEKVLLVLDDVDNKEQVDALAGELNWFGQGSRVIITTTNEHILNVAKVVKDKICWLQRLDREESLELFSLHAFSMDEPPQEYMQLSHDIIRYSEGLPLILEMLGSYLSNINSKEEWKSTLRKLKGDKASISNLGSFLASLRRQREKTCPMKDNPVGSHPLYNGTTGINNTVARVSKVLGGCLDLSGYATTDRVGKRFTMAENQAELSKFTEDNLNPNGSTAIDRDDNNLFPVAENQAELLSKFIGGSPNPNCSTAIDRIDNNLFQVAEKQDELLFEFTRGSLNPNGTKTIDRDGNNLFTKAEIRAATKNFDNSLVIGEGGFGTVYKGVLYDGTQAAFKRAHLPSIYGQGRVAFETEIQMLSKLKHTHVVSLIGFCKEKNEMTLVYEYMANGDLSKHLFGSDLPPLTWKQRLEICIGVARGINYLHTWGEGAIIHRDVKTSNILLDENFVAKIADFGISITDTSLYDPFFGSLVTGTAGYIDPEYKRSRKLTKKSDVYSFGVVLLEVFSGRPLSDARLSKQRAYNKGWESLETIVDQRLEGSYSQQSLKQLGRIARRCVADASWGRPTMMAVLLELEYIFHG